jgi:transitional endoplasmic reticulum ATPase
VKCPHEPFPDTIVPLARPVVGHSHGIRYRATHGTNDPVSYPKPIYHIEALDGTGCTYTFADEFTAVVDLSTLTPEDTTMSRTDTSASDLTKRVVTKVIDFQIERNGTKIVLPESASLKECRDFIDRTMEHEEQVVDVHEELDCFALEGALALRKAVERIFGVALTEASTVEGMFGPMKDNAKELTIATGPDKFETAPWGQYPLLIPDRPKGKGDSRTNPYAVDWIQTEYKVKGRQIVFGFIITGKVRRKYLPLVKRIVDLTRKIVEDESIYRGQAFRIKFRDEDGDMLGIPEITFLDTKRTDPKRIILRRDLEEVLYTNIWTTILHQDACKAAGIPFKRGVLLAGMYGTGKTLIAEATAKYAVDNGVTYGYLTDVRELADMIRFMKPFGKGVVFSEDVDRVFAEGDRTVFTDRILNTLDGVDSKHQEIMVVLTTNYIENIDPAMLRPGRLDVVLTVEPPDAEAAERLIRMYAGTLLGARVQLTAASQILAGNIPAVIREAVERSKMAAIYRTGRAVGDGDLTEQDIVVSARTMKAQADLLTPKKPDTRSVYEKAADIHGKHVIKAAEVSKASVVELAAQPVNGTTIRAD